MSKEVQTRNRVKLIVLIAVFAAPMIAAYLTYHFWQPQKYVNYGELIQPRPLPQSKLTRLDGSVLEFSQLKGKWLFVTIDSGSCIENCDEKLYKIRQVRLTQGKDMGRIERVWLIDDSNQPSRELLDRYPEMQIAHADSTFLNDFLADRNNYIFLIDPLGNLMIRYNHDADPRKMMKDLARLLKVSQVG